MSVSLFQQNAPVHVFGLVTMVARLDIFDQHTKLNTLRPEASGIQLDKNVLGTKKKAMEDRHAKVEVWDFVDGLNSYVEGLDPIKRLQTVLDVEYILNTGSNHNPEWKSSVVELQSVYCGKMMGEGKKESDTGGHFERVLNGDPWLCNGVAGCRQSLKLIGELVFWERGTKLSIVGKVVRKKAMT
ncbi:hypothetical protein B0H19DRAFT_1071217 [Mycena capillaripes]|nr:hypothetical protein B0H19DRAFT_1071217 [Mycena capillaripes]